MFNLTDILNLFNIITTIGFAISSISGFNTINNTSNLVISIYTLIIFFIVLLIEYFNYKYDYLDQKNKYYLTGTIMILTGILLLGINTITCAFGVLSILVGIVNINYSFFVLSKPHSFLSFANDSLKLNRQDDNISENVSQNIHNKNTITEQLLSNP
jgi:hypothetical protein